MEQEIRALSCSQPSMFLFSVPEPKRRRALQGQQQGLRKMEEECEEACPLIFVCVLKSRPTSRKKVHVHVGARSQLIVARRGTLCTMQPWHRMPQAWLLPAGQPFQVMALAS